MKTIQSLHLHVAMKRIAAALLLSLLPWLGACKADFSSDVDALFLLKVMNSGLEISSLGNRISPAPELKELVARPKNLLKAAAAPGSVLPPAGIRLHAVLEDDEIIPLRIYPAGSHIELHAMTQTRDYILLHYRGAAIDCPLVIISKGDYSVTCGWSAGDYLAEFGVVYPGVSGPGFREKHPFVLASVQQHEGELLITAGGRPYVIALGEGPRSMTKDIQLSETFSDGVVLKDARVNRTGDTLRLFEGYRPRVMDARTGDVHDDFAPMPGEGPGDFLLSYNPADDSFLTMALHFPAFAPAFVNWRRRRGIPVRRLVRIRGVVPPDIRFTAHTRCGRAGDMFLMGAEDTRPILVRVGSRRGRVRAVAQSPDFPGGPAVMACGGNRLFAHFVNEDAGTEAIHRFNLRGGARSRVFAGADYSISDLVPLSRKVVLFVARHLEDGEVYLVRAERARGWRTTRRAIPSDIRSVLPLYNMSEPATTNGLPAMSSQPIFRK